MSIALSVWEFEIKGGRFEYSSFRLIVKFSSRGRNGRRNRGFFHMYLRNNKKEGNARIAFATPKSIIYVLEAHPENFLLHSKTKITLSITQAKKKS